MAATTDRAPTLFEASGNSAVITLYPDGETRYLDMDSPVDRKRYAALEACVARVELMTDKRTPSYESARLTAFAGGTRDRFELCVPAGYTARLTGDFATLNPGGDVMVVIDADSPYNAGQVRLDDDLNLIRPGQLDPDRLRLAPDDGGHGLFVDVDDHYLSLIATATADRSAVDARMPRRAARYVASNEAGLRVGCSSVVLSPDRTGRFVAYDPDTDAGRMAIAMIPVGASVLTVMTDRDDPSPYDVVIREDPAGLSVETGAGYDIAVEGDLTALEGRSLVIRAADGAQHGGSVALSALAARTQYALIGGAVALRAMRVEHDPTRAMAWARAAGIPPRVGVARPAVHAPQAVQGMLDLDAD